MKLGVKVEFVLKAGPIYPKSFLKFHFSYFKSVHKNTGGVYNFIYISKKTEQHFVNNNLFDMFVNL